jgi:hypothetical protein
LLQADPIEHRDTDRLCYDLIDDDGFNAEIVEGVQFLVGPVSFPFFATGVELGELFLLFVFHGFMVKGKF